MAKVNDKHWLAIQLPALGNQISGFAEAGQHEFEWRKSLAMKGGLLVSMVKAKPRAERRHCSV